MALPDLKLIIEALRGGNGDHSKTPMVSRNYDTGVVTRYGKPPVMQKQGMMPTQMRGWQLYNQEQSMNGAPPVSYEQWMKMQSE